MQKIGDSIIQRLKGASAFDYSFKKKTMASTMKTKTCEDHMDVTAKLTSNYFPRGSLFSFNITILRKHPSVNYAQGHDHSLINKVS